VWCCFSSLDFLLLEALPTESLLLLPTLAFGGPLPSLPCQRTSKTATFTRLKASRPCLSTIALEKHSSSLLPLSSVHSSNSLSLLYFFLFTSPLILLHSTFTTNSTEPVASFPALATQASDLVGIVCSLRLSSPLMPSPVF
jgi:hypothetical protein